MKIEIDIPAEVASEFRKVCIIKNKSADEIITKLLQDEIGLYVNLREAETHIRLQKALFTDKFEAKEKCVPQECWHLFDRTICGKAYAVIVVCETGMYMTVPMDCIEDICDVSEEKKGES